MCQARHFDFIAKTSYTKYSSNSRRITEMSRKSININLEVGQTILVGKNEEPAEITKIEFHEKSGDIKINTTRGPRKALTFKLLSDEEQENTQKSQKKKDREKKYVEDPQKAADKYR